MQEFSLVLIVGSYTIGILTKFCIATSISEEPFS